MPWYRKGDGAEGDAPSPNHAATPSETRVVRKPTPEIHTPPPGSGTRPVDFPLPPIKEETRDITPPGQGFFNKGAGGVKTQLLGAGHSQEEMVAHGPITRSFRPDPMDDPVVGWLVVVDGPGKGSSRQIGIGRNSIGRGQDSRICLDFDDDNMSRKEHATIVYDNKSRKFFLQPGDGVNLTYLNDSVVLSPVELSHGHQITLGKTKVRFIPFCGPETDWQDL